MSPKARAPLPGAAPVTVDPELRQAAQLLAAEPLARALFKADTAGDFSRSALKLVREAPDNVIAAARTVLATAPQRVLGHAALTIAVEPGLETRTRLMALFPVEVGTKAIDIRKCSTPEELAERHREIYEPNKADSGGEAGAGADAKKGAPFGDNSRGVGQQATRLVKAGMPSSPPCCASTRTCLFGMTPGKMVAAGVVVVVSVALAVPAYRKFKEWRTRCQEGGDDRGSADGGSGSN